MEKTYPDTLGAQTRLQHARENTADYLEIIADLIQKNGEARATDVAERLGVTRGTVNNKLRRLQKLGLIRSQPYRSSFLNPEGTAMAGEARQRHHVVLQFLIALGVPQKVAEQDAEGIEHHVSPQTVRTLASLTLYLKNRPLS